MPVKKHHPSIKDSTLHMKAKKNIALIAHDHRKMDLLDWAEFNSEFLKNHNLFGTGTTGSLVAQKLNIPVLCLYRPGEGNRLSAMVSGNAIFTCREYTVFIEAQKWIDDFIVALT